MMDVVMQQVPVLRNEAWCRGLVVIRAEHAGQRTISRQVREQAAKNVGVNGDVGVDERDRRSSGCLEAAVSRECRAARLPAETDYAVGRHIGDAGAVIGTCIVHHDQLPCAPVQITLIERGETARKHFRSVVNRDDYRERRGVSHPGPIRDAPTRGACVPAAEP